jgi:hypothetical protein
VKFPFEHRRKVLQPGQPTSSEWVFENAGEPQPLNLHLLLAGETAKARDITIEVDRSFSVTVPAVLKTGESLVWDGSGRVKMYDDKGRATGEVVLGRSLPPLDRGRHTVAIDARFASGADLALKGTVKLKGTVEHIEK